ncbi:hypothetical protein [Thermococcus celericrescens]|uniref:hypothetical protein n=1 Tax=Thermococcus celericrescens TaxID=227598 RepID=UPI00073D7690|nr:hypothetical protein [Thermococcus celericrescens]
MRNSQRFSLSEELIQVSYDVSDPETFGREVRALKKAMCEFGIKRARLITWDVEKSVDGVEIIPLWRFLLEDY